MLNRRTSFTQGDATRAAKGAIRVWLTVWKVIATEQGVRVICHGDMQDRRAVRHHTLKWIGDTFQTKTQLPARKAPVSQAEVARYLKAARQAGFPVARVEISPDGKLALHTALDPTGETLNDWDAP